MHQNRQTNPQANFAKYLMMFTAATLFAFVTVISLLFGPLSNASGHAPESEETSKTALPASSDAGHCLEIGNMKVKVSPSRDDPGCFSLALVGNIEVKPDILRQGRLRAYLVDDGEDILAVADGKVREGEDGATVLFASELDEEQLEAWSEFHITLTSGFPVAVQDDTAASVACAKASFERRSQNSVSAETAGDYSDVLMVGDSIMVLTSEEACEAMPGISIDACSSRSLEAGGIDEGYSPADGVLDHLRRDVGEYRRYVIGTGNNDSYGMGIDEAEEIVSLLSRKQIWFVTEYVSDNTRSTDTTNDTIEAMCAKYPNVHKAEWYDLIMEHTDEWLLGDNCHPQTIEAREAYAGLVKESLDKS